MREYTPLLAAAAAIALAAPAMAGFSGTPQEEPFYWTEDESDPAAETLRDRETSSGKSPVAKHGPVSKGEPVSKGAPVSKGSPVDPGGNTARYHGDCAPTEHMPETKWITPSPRKYSKDTNVESRTSAERRRGEMTGDDGVLEAIQTRPCVVIHRRGGETPESIRKYTHPDDIRRANILEDRRIPHHSVGTYDPEGSSQWYRGNNTPYGNAYQDTAQEWQVIRGKMLSELLIAWGREADFEVVWESPHDYLLQADVIIEGTFPEAAGKVIESFDDANPPLFAEFYLANKVLVVTSANDFDGR